MPIDTEKLLTILNAAQNPTFKKLLEERTKKQDEKAKLDAELAALDEKISASIPPELLTLLSPAAKATEPGKTRKRRSKEELEAAEIPAPEAIVAPAPEILEASVVA